MCLESLDGLHAVLGAQEARKGILGHQTVDPLLGLVESVGTRRVHHTQQSLAGLSIQVHLKEERDDYHKKKPLQSFICSELSQCYVFLSTNLLRGIRVDELAVDAAGLGLLQSGRGNSVLLTSQPECKVLLAEL